MCNLSQGIEEKGRIKGLMEGRAEGMAEERLSAIRNLMASMGWPAEQAMEALQIPEAERQTYAALLQKQ